MRDFFIRPRYVSGITVIELVLILVIIIALLLIFKTQLINLINTIFDKITSESSGI
ncbi:Flp1 family type IVb pilin [[Ruminococcus] torques]|uniref:Flp1 family type IVb pilin n=1 Tax=[Ruminococcus] torques TaxID=33039 RepID=UPI003B509E1F